jgi:hypothetical protein
MALPPKQRPKNANNGGSKSQTRNPASAGRVLPVTKPMDLWYLCQKVGFAEMFPLKNDKGFPMYQRTVSRWIRLDYQLARSVWPYCAEVGFDMLAPGGPTAIMSKTAPVKEGYDRPSTMPLSVYDAIRDRTAIERGISQFPNWNLGLRAPLDDKTTLENHLTPADLKEVHKMVLRKDEELDKRGKIKMPGALRIPDVIRVKDFMFRKGADRYKAENIAYLIEMKFATDRLSPEQADDYLLIVNGDRFKFRLLKTEVCKTRRRRDGRLWLEKARQTEPVFGVVEPGIASPAPLKQALAQYHLLINEILREQEKVRRLLNPGPLGLPLPPPKESTPVMTAWDPQVQAEIARQREHKLNTLMLAVVIPPAIAAATALAAGTVLLAGGAAFGESATVIVTNAGKLIQFPAGRIAIGAAAANGAVFSAAAQDALNNSSTAQQELTFYYIAD